LGGAAGEQAAEHDRNGRAGSAAVTGRRSSVMVSPTRVSATSLIEAVSMPISPGPSSSIGTSLGVYGLTMRASCVVLAQLQSLNCIAGKKSRSHVPRNSHILDRAKRFRGEVLAAARVEGSIRAE